MPQLLEINLLFSLVSNHIPGKPPISLPPFPEIPPIGLPPFPEIPPIIIDPEHLTSIYSFISTLFITIMYIRSLNKTIDIGLTSYNKYEHWQSGIRRRPTAEVVKYGIYDYNDKTSFLLWYLYSGSNTNMYWTWDWSWATGCYLGVQNHQDYFINNGPFTYYRPEPFIPYDGFNGELIISLLVPKPTVMMWNLYKLLNITVLANNQPVQYNTEVPDRMRIHAKLKDLKDSPEGI